MYKLSIYSFITVFFTLNIFHVNGHVNASNNTTSDFRKFQIGINFSPDICYRTLKNNDGSNTSQIVIRIRNENETIKLGYTTGLNFCYNFNTSIGIETGVQFSNKGYQSKMKSLRYNQPEPDDPLFGKFRYNFYCMDIPLKANITFGEKKLRLLTSFGLTTNILFKETSTSVLIYSDGKKRKEAPQGYDFNNLNFSPTLGIGIDYQINNRMHLRVEPTFRYNVLKIIDTPVTAYLYNGGINISYLYGL